MNKRGLVRGLNVDWHAHEDGSDEHQSRVCEGDLTSSGEVSSNESGETGPVGEDHEMRFDTRRTQTG